MNDFNITGTCQKDKTKTYCVIIWQIIILIDNSMIMFLKRWNNFKWIIRVLKIYWVLIRDNAESASRMRHILILGRWIRNTKEFSVKGYISDIVNYVSDWVNVYIHKCLLVASINIIRNSTFLIGIGAISY